MTSRDPKWPKWNDLITWQFYIGWRSAEFTCSKFWGTVQNPHELSRTANKWKVSHQMRHGDDSYITTHIWVINWQYESLKISVPCLEEFHQWHFQQHHRTSTWPVVPVLIRCPGKPWTPDRLSRFLDVRPHWTGTIKLIFSPHTPNNYPHTPEWLGGSNPWLMTPRAQCHPVVNSPYHQEPVQYKPTISPFQYKPWAYFESIIKTYSYPNPYNQAFYQNSPLANMPPPPPHPPVPHPSNQPTQQPTHAQPAPHPSGPPPSVHTFENPFIHSYPLRPPPGKIFNSCINDKKRWLNYGVTVRK